MGTRILTPHPTQRNDANALDAIAFSRYRVRSVPELAMKRAGAEACAIRLRASGAAFPREGQPE